MDQNKKRFSCSVCGYESGIKDNLKKHINSKTLHANEKTIPYIIDTPTISCKYCLASVKTMTKINHMEEHMKTCSGKDQVAAVVINNTQNIQNNYNNYNININPYDYPTTRFLVYSENLVLNRVEIFKQVYVNVNIPQNHSLVFDKENFKIKVYSNNECYITIDMGYLSTKISAPLDRIQQQLLEDNVIDKNEVKRINDLIDSNYGEYEAKNKSRYGEIIRDYQDIPQNTRRIIDQEKQEQNLLQ